MSPSREECVRQPSVDFWMLMNLNDVMSLELRSGDEEGSFEVVIENEAREHAVSVNLLVSGAFELPVIYLWPFVISVPDTTEYPKSHTLFCYASDGELPTRLQTVIEEFANEPSHPVRDTLLLLLSRVSRALGLRSTQPNRADPDSGEETEEVEEDDDDDDDYAMLSDDDPVYNADSFAVPSNQCDVSILQR